MKIFLSITALSLLLIISASHAQTGVIDSTFGINGVVKTPLSDSGSAVCNKLLSLPDGKIIATGYAYSLGHTRFVAVRYFNNGKVDSSYGTNGVVTTIIENSAACICYSSVLQKDGKAVLVGDYLAPALGYNFAVVRYDTSGHPDNSFGTGGIGINHVGIAGADNVGLAIDLQSDGKIIVAGKVFNTSNYNFAVLRFNANGSVDSTFGTNGSTVSIIGAGNDNCYSMAVQKDDKIVLAGDIEQGAAYNFTVARYTSNGILDNTFGTGGIATHPIGAVDDDYGYSVVIQPDQKIIVGGEAKNNANYDFALMRLDTTGALDNAFGNGGFVLADFKNNDDIGRSTALQPDGKILLFGSTYAPASQFGLMRFDANGSPDSAFATNGRAELNIYTTTYYGYSVVMDINNKILIAGQASLGKPDNFILARFTSGLPNTVGIPEQTATAERFHLYPNPAENQFTVYGLQLTSGDEIKIYDLSGRVVERKIITKTTNSQQLSTQNLSSGLYFVQIISAEYSGTQKLIIR